ncbi:hypothetical protein OC834_003585 [Tilletia horrida]|nr:hypothetical protein OC834_003585 [Tilletia horrida]
MSADSFAAELAAIAAQPATARTDAYIDLYTRTANTPESELSSDTLQRLTANFLDAAAFSDLNSTGGGLVVGRNVLAAFHRLLSEARREEDGEAAAAAADGDNDAVMGGSSSSSGAGGSRPRRAVDDVDTRINLIDDALERLQPKILSFEEQASQLRILLSSILEAEHDWIRAAQALQGIPLDGSSGQRSVTDLFRLRTYMRIVRLLLEGDDAVQADIYLKRASLLIHSVPGASSRSFGTLDMSEAAASADLSAAAASSSTPAEQVTKEAIQEGRELSLHFQLCQARIYDSQKRFAEAAMRFHKLSYIAEIDPSDRELMLSAAVTAAILAPAGVTRTRILGTLVRDERTSNLPAHQTAILTKVFLQQIVRPKEIAAFEEMLAPHQKAILVPSANEKAMLAIAQAHETNAASGDSEMDGGGASGSASTASAPSKRHAPRTVLERAIIEHNLLSASKIYTTITLSGLGSLLDMSPFGAETIARRMIKERRLVAEIDQVEGVLIFLAHGAEVGGEGAGAGAGVAGGAEAGGGDDARRPAAGATTSPLADLGGDGTGPEGSGDLHSAYTRRWDAQIGRTASALEDVFQRINRMGGVVSSALAAAADASSAPAEVAPIPAQS